MIRALLRRLRRDQSGTALIEFAFALPVLIILFFGSYQMSDAIACKRRVTIMTRAVGDLTSQYREMTTADLNTVMAASIQIMAPYAGGQARIRVSQLTVRPDGQTFNIDWSCGRNAEGYDTGLYDAAYMPAAYRQPNMTFILTQTGYDYDSALTTYFKSMYFEQAIWLLPRRSSTITLNQRDQACA